MVLFFSFSYEHITFEVLVLYSTRVFKVRTFSLLSVGLMIGPEQ